jgi:hypothetical protein
VSEKVVDAVLFFCNARKSVLCDILFWLRTALGTVVFDCNTHKHVTVILLASSEWDAGIYLVVSTGANKVTSDIGAWQIDITFRCSGTGSWHEWHCYIFWFWESCCYTVSNGGKDIAASSWWLEYKSYSKIFHWGI